MKTIVLIALTCLSAISSELLSDDISGEIVGVQGDVFSITLDSDQSPQVQDEVEIFVDVPGVGRAVVATASVIEVAPKSVRAKLVRATGRVQVGHRIVIRPGNLTTPKSEPFNPSASENPPGNDSTTNDADKNVEENGRTKIKFRSALNGLSQEERRAVSESIKVIPKYHLSGRPFDDLIAERISQLFPDLLDPNRLYLEEQDVAKFLRDVDRLKGQYRSGELTSCYRLVETYVRRAHERVEWVEKFLSEKHDFLIDETLIIDPHGRFLSRSELEDQWRKNVKRELVAHQQAGASLEEAVRLTRKQFQNSLEQVQKWNGSDVVNASINCLANAYGPQSSYLSPKKVEDFYISQQQQLEGIGATLKLVDSYVTIENIVAGGPAAEDGRLSVGDRIVAVGQGAEGELVDVIAVRLEDAVGLIRGPANSMVRLKIISEGRFTSKILEIKRGVVNLVNTLQSVLVPAEIVPAGRSCNIGFVRCDYIYQDIRNKENPHRASVDLSKILDGFNQQGVELVVLDLRGCTGGPLGEVFAVAGLFLGDVPVTQVRDGQGKVDVYTTQLEKIVWQGPLVILAGRGTGSGAELLIAAFKDHLRCLVVGDEKTYGTGTSQNLVDVNRLLAEQPGATAENIPNLGILKLTTSMFFSPSGVSPQKVGVASDVALPSLYEVLISERADLKYALEPDRVNASKIVSFGMIDEKLRQQLRELSKKRVVDSSFFQNLGEQIEERKRKQELASGRYLYPLTLPQSPPAPSSDSDEAEETPVVLIADPRVVADGYLTEVLNVGLDYLARLSYLAAEKSISANQLSVAIDEYRRSVKADPTYVRAQYKLGWNLATCRVVNLKDAEQAVAHCTMACELDGYKTWSYLLGLAVAESEAGEFESAGKHLQAALDKAPEKQAAKYRYLVTKFQERKSFMSK